MKKFAVLGLGTFGSGIAKSLTEKGAEVIAVDRQMQLVEEIQEYVSIAVQLDSTDENALKAQGIHEVDVAIVCIGEDFESNLLTSVILKELEVPFVVTRATSSLEEKILTKVGIDRVVLPEQEIAEKLSYSLVHPNFEEIFYLGANISVAEVQAPKGFVGKSLEEIRLRSKHGLTLITIERKKEEKGKEEEKTPRVETILPDAKTIIQENDSLILVGNKKDIQNFLAKF
ncbi:MAG: TrkA family potassium uptake protein [Calditrichaeota bacterium]|nr:TrkA family potassium uptake protein [Calditrichota bacterium]RQV99445.1 MAG: TrkA family potassium uptake protein [Calditrichota bacterium]